MPTRAKSPARKPRRRAKSPARTKGPAKAARKAPARRKKTAATWAPPTGPGTVCWNELMTTDLEGAKSFYGALFGWTSKDMSMAATGPYAVLSRGTDGVGGLQPVNPGWDGGRPLWLPSILVEDVDATVEKATTLGATVMTPPTDVMGFGRYAVLRDPQGALVSLWKSKETWA